MFNEMASYISHVLALLFTVYLILNLTKHRKQHDSEDDFYAVSGSDYVTDFYKTVLVDIAMVIITTGLLFYVHMWSVGMFFVFSTFVRWVVGIKAISLHDAKVSKARQEMFSSHIAQTAIGFADANNRVLTGLEAKSEGETK